MLTSRTYQQSSARTSQLDELDPENRLWGRMPIKRLESEIIRDSILSVSGDLINELGGAPTPVMEDEVGQVVLGQEKLDGEGKPTTGEDTSSRANRRSVYVQVRRTRPLAVLETLDTPSLAPNCVSRNNSNVAPQALMLMNSQFAIRYSKRLANRVTQEKNSLTEQVARIWELCYCRPITESQSSKLVEFVKKQQVTIKNSNSKLTPEQTQHLALANVCQALMSSNEFLYVD